MAGAGPSTAGDALGIVRFQFCFDFRAEGVENHLRSRAILQHADRQAARAGPHEQAVPGNLRLKNHFLGQQLPQCGGGFGAFGEVVLHHRQAHAQHREAGVHDECPMVPPVGES